MESQKLAQRPRIGEMLIRQGIVSPDAVDHAVERQRSGGGKIVEELLAHGALDMDKFVDFLSAPAVAKVVELKRFDIPQSVVTLIPRNFACMNEIVPIELKDDTLTIASSHPLDDAIADALADHTGYKIHHVVCAAEDVQVCLNRHYRNEDSAATAIAISSAMRLNTAISMIKRIDRLPALPGTVQRVRELIEGGCESASEVGEVIARDPAIAAHVLKLANSAAYGFAKRVDDVSLAVSLLGLKETYSIVVSSAVVSMFGKSDTFDYAAFWLQSTVTASMVKLFASRFDKELQAGAFSAGLLADLGRAALAHVAPDGYSRVDRSLTGAELVAAEEAALGLSHTEAGYQLAIHWELPENLGLCLRHHHAPKHAPVEHRKLSALVSLAQHVAAIHRADAESRELHFSGCEDALAILEIAPDDVAAALEDAPEADAMSTSLN